VLPRLGAASTGRCLDWVLPRLGAASTGRCLDWVLLQLDSQYNMKNGS